MNNDYNNGNDYTSDHSQQQNSASNGQENPGFGEYRQSNPGFGEYRQSDFSTKESQNQSNGEQEQRSYTPPFNGGPVYNMAQPPEEGRSSASASQTLGIIGLVSSVVCCCFPVIGLVLGILAIVFSNKATKACGFTPSGASVGKICGIIAIVLCGLIILTNILSLATGFVDRFTEEIYQNYPELYT